jgi:5,10-methylenetetrahydromethanopterin reductase
VLTYDFRLPPGPRTVEFAMLAEDLGFRAVWCPEIPAFGHDIWVTLARIAEKTKRIKFGPSVLIPSYRHPMAQASAIATLEQTATSPFTAVITLTFPTAMTPLSTCPPPNR